MKRVYSVESREDDNAYLVNASSEEAALVWVAANEEMSYTDAAREFTVRPAIIAEAL